MAVPNGEGASRCSSSGDAQGFVGWLARHPLNKSDLFQAQVFGLHYGRARRSMVEVVPDADGLYRIRWPSGELSRSANLTRCRDAARCWAEGVMLTEHRKMNGARRLKSLDNFSWSASPMRKNDLRGSMVISDTTTAGMGVASS